MIKWYARNKNGSVNVEFDNIKDCCIYCDKYNMAYDLEISISMFIENRELFNKRIDEHVMPYNEDNLNIYEIFTSNTK